MHALTLDRSLRLLQRYFFFFSEFVCFFCFSFCFQIYLYFLYAVRSNTVIDFHFTLKFPFWYQLKHRLFTSFHWERNVSLFIVSLLVAFSQYILVYILYIYWMCVCEQSVCIYSRVSRVSFTKMECIFTEHVCVSSLFEYI